MSKYTSKKSIWATQGPFGFSMPDRLAKAAEIAIKSQPKEIRDRFKASIGGQTTDGYLRRFIVPKAMDLLPGEQADVSIINTDDRDRDDEVTLPKGVDFSEFRVNSAVSFCHQYEELPVGRCEWVAAAKLDSGGDGWKAKTRYTPRPKDYPPIEWFPETVWGFVSAGDLPGKSLGYIPLAMRNPTAQELEARPDWKGADIISRCMVLEYAVCLIPVVPTTVVQSIAKMKAKGLIVPRSFLSDAGMHIPDDIPSTSAVETPIIINTKAVMDAPVKRSCLMLNVPDHIAKCMKAMGAKIPDEALSSDGREDSPHVTALYGLHTTDPNEVAKALDGVGPVSAKLGKTDAFLQRADNGESPDNDQDVVHCAVESPDLMGINQKLVESMPHDETHEYAPHMTLAYTKAGEGAKYKDMEDAMGMAMTSHDLTFADPLGNETPITLTGKKAIVGETKKVIAKKAAGASEGDNAGGGYAVPEEYASGDKMPACPKCKALTTKADDWTPTSAFYYCETCDDDYEMNGAGDLTSRELDNPDVLPGSGIKAKAKGKVMLNHRAVAWAEAQIKSGRIDHGDSIAETVGDTVADDKYYLAHDGGYDPSQKGYRMFPIGSGAGVNATNVGLASGYAKKNGYADIEKAADALSESIKAKESADKTKALRSFVADETIDAMVEREMSGRMAGVPARVKAMVIERVHERLGTP